ncbi:MAG: hypothetical protein FJX77_06475, partial [Armatimonadetes bacterium]|nr:hypothetical protein [Armatimonadota bacterium]
MRTRARWAAPWVAALILAGVAPRLSAYQGGSTAALKMSVTILPFLQGAGGSQTPPSVTGDDDGYGVAAARIKARGQGPSAVLAAALNSNGRLVAYSSSGKPEAEAPLQAQACVMVFEHRPARAPAKGQEAVVELAVRVSATSGNAELFTDFYRASMPAKGPFSKQAAAYLLHHGISNYRNTPLGKAFFKAVQNSISGAPEPEQRAQNFGIVPGIGRVVWQARVTGKQGSAYVINAGGKNGLKAG